MKLGILTLPLTLTLGLAATAFAADLPDHTQTDPAAVAPSGNLAKDKALKKECGHRTHKHGKCRQAAKSSQQPVKK